MAIKLQDILDMPVMQNATVLAGHGGLGREVTSTTVLDAPDGAKWLKGREFAFTSTYSMRDMSNELSTLVQDLSDRNVSALGVKLNRFIVELPDSMLKKADELDLPIISLPPEKAWIEFITPIMSEILNNRASQLIISDEINRNFTNTLLANSSMEHIAELIYRYVANPVALLLMFNDTIVHVPELNAGADPSYAAFLDDLSRSAPMDKELLPFQFETYRIVRADEAYVVIPLYHQEELIGYICVKELNREVDGGDADCLLHAKNAVLLKSLNVRAEQEIQRRYRNEFFSNLLYKKIEDADLSDLKRRAWEVGVQLSDVYDVIVVQVNDQNVQNMYKFVDDIAAHELLAEGGLAGMDKKNHIVLLLPHRDDGFPAVEHALGQLLQNLMPDGDSVRWAAGASRQHRLITLAEGYEHAVEALYHGIQVVGYGRVQQYGEMGIYRLFSHPLLREEIVKYVEEWLGPVLRYDLTSQANLLKTLEIFLETGGNYRGTAKQLYLHYNTVRYRMQMINRLLGCDLDRSKVRLQLQIALLLLPLSARRDG